MCYNNTCRRTRHTQRRATTDRMKLPEDDIIALSYINTLLRDEYASLRELCEDNDLSPGEVCTRMARAGYSYDEQTNSFR